MAHHSARKGRDDETEIRSEETDGRQGDQRYPSGHPQNLFCGKKSRIVLEGLRGEDNAAFEEDRKQID
ncbi:hypothetical protein [Martelella sp. FOR1707]